MKADQLRKAILQMAIQGKLVPQDPNDEPASILLEKIRAEKQRLIKEGKIKKDKVDSIIYKGEDNRYYEKIGNEVILLQDLDYINIPESWAICRFSVIANIFTGNSINEQKKAKKYLGLTDGYNYIGTKDVAFDKTINYNNGVKIPFDTQFKIAHEGTPLLCIEGGSAGRKIGILKEDVCFGNKLCAFESFGVNTEYIYYFLQTPVFIDVFKSNTTGIIGGVSVNTIKSLFFFIPPFGEQEKIVAEIKKYEPLIAEFNKFEQEKSKLDSEIYDKLKKSILQYAIQGKLVPQDPNDEPASELLKRIRAEKKAQLGKKYIDSYIYKGDDNCYYEKVGNNEPILLEKLPFKIPNSWAWARLGNVIELLSGRDLEPSQYNVDQKGMPYITGASNFDGNKLIINRWTDTPLTISKLGDLLITCKGTIGAMAYNTIGDIHIARQVMAISTQYIAIEYIKLFLTSYIHLLEANAKSFIPGISRDDINLSLIPIPPHNEQLRICDRLSKLFNHIEKDEG